MFVNMAGELLLQFFQIIILSFLVVLPFAYDLSSKFRYYFKHYVFYVLIASASVLLLPITTWKFLRRRKISSISNICDFIGKTLNVKWKILGLENLQQNNLCVLVKNQQGFMDIIGILKVWPYLDECVIIADDKIYSNPMTLLWSKKQAFFETIKCGSETLPSKNIKDIVNKNINIWIFPRKLHDIKSDIFHMLVKENLPIVPIIISNYYFINKSHKTFESGKVAIKILPPISTVGYSIDDVTNLIHEVDLIMNKEFECLSKKLTPPSLRELRHCYVH